MSLKDIFNSDKRKLKKVEKQIKPIIALEDKYKKMTDEELRNQTTILKAELAKGKKLNDILVPAFATAREACRRVRGEFPYPTQLEGAVILEGGDVAELKTGEGKTLTSVMAVYLEALTGKGVHMVTVNEYLARRDWESMGEVHKFLGLTVGLSEAGMMPAAKRAAYECDITYVTNSELGFDYLRDNMVQTPEDRVLRGLHTAFVDEADSILIDEARTPLIISGGEREDNGLYVLADSFAKYLKPADYEIDARSKSIMLTESGITKAEKRFNKKNIYEPENALLLHRIGQALKANYIMKIDIDYVVRDGADGPEVMIVDPNTGRVMEGRQWSDGLHQAVEAKEGIQVKQETITRATITYQNFFRMYEKLAGMTGTAKSEEEEFLEIYNMFVYQVPTYRPVIRIDYDDAVFGTKKAKYAAIVQEVEERHAKGQPILLGTIAVETSELLSKMLTRKHIPHNVLNAKNHALEAEIIANAGQVGAVTIATNMAGRGTDIKLGEGARELGGLCVIGSERHESRRIDDQLRGRSGRQGDPGMSRFYVSVEDDLVIRFGAERLEALFKSLGDERVESKQVTAAIESAQHRVEGQNYDARKHLLEFDDVMRIQREAAYSFRDEFLDATDEEVADKIHHLYELAYTNVAETSVNDETGNIDSASVINKLDKMGFKSILPFDTLSKEGSEKLADACTDASWQDLQTKIEPVAAEFPRVARQVAIRSFDRAWSQHIDDMAQLKAGITLRSYANMDPLKAYIKEGNELFDSMMYKIATETTSFFNRSRVQAVA